jgi:quercetin 2,3-dioxygenase
VDYNIKSKGNGVYLFVLAGDVTVGNQQLKPRDGYGIWDIDKFIIKADTDAEFLLMEVPMK